MCGLVGVAGEIGDRESKIFRNLLILDQFRGRHSTGVLALDYKPETNKVYHELYKSVGAPENLFNKYDKDFIDGVYGFETCLLMGHNRFATQGEINEDNAHPFEFNDVIGCHNGTVHKYSMRDFHDYSKYEVDSQIIFSELNHSNDVAKVWENADGAMALVWWCFKDMKLKIIRNNKRPLSYYISPDHKTIYWASESWMLLIALSQSNVRIEQKDIQSFEEDKLYTINPLTETTKMKVKSYKKLEIEISKAFKKKVWPVAEYNPPKNNKGVFNYGGKSKGGDTSIYMMHLETHPLPDNKCRHVFEALDEHPNHQGKTLYLVMNLEYKGSIEKWEGLNINLNKDYIYTSLHNLYGKIGEEADSVYYNITPWLVHKSSLITSMKDYQGSKKKVH